MGGDLDSFLFGERFAGAELGKWVKSK